MPALIPLPAPVSSSTSRATYSLARTDRVLVVTVVGEASNRPDCIGIYGILDDSIKISERDFRPEALAFDFSRLQYEWGDGMARLIASWGLPVAVVTSSINHPALSSLLSEELFVDPQDHLVSSLEDALTLLDKYLNASDGA